MSLNIDTVVILVVMVVFGGFLFYINRSGGK